PLHRHNHDQYDAQPEVGDGHARQRKQVGAELHLRPLAHRRQDAQRYPHQDGEEHGHNGQLYGDGQLLRHQRRDGNVGAQRYAQISLADLFDPGDILDRKGIVQPILLAQEIQHGGITLFARHGQHRVARQYLLQTEYHDRHQYQRGYGYDDTAQNKLEHAIESWLA